MKQYTDFNNRYIAYLQHQNEVMAGAATNKWFEEFYEEPENSELLDIFMSALDCGTRSSTKEMLDDQAQVDRARTIRNKGRSDFFVAARTRHDGAIFNLEKKSIFLSDEIK